MHDAVVRPGRVAGTIEAPPAKSETHRAYLLLALAGGGSVANPLVSGDTRATAIGLEALGAPVTSMDDGATVSGFPDGRPTAPPAPIDCANSGTTLRLLAGQAALADGRTTLTGDASLRARPNEPLLAAIRALGGEAQSAADGTAPIEVEGPIDGGEITLSGSISSQFVSSLLIAGAATDEGIAISFSEPLISTAYARLTAEMLADVGVVATIGDEGCRVEGGTRLRSPEGGFEVGPDPTGASYLLAAGILAGDGPVTVPDVGTRGGRPAPILGVLESMAVPVDRGDGVTVRRCHPVPATIDLREAPDLVPTAAILAGIADGTTRLENCGHARYKETDRIATTAGLLRALGRPVEEGPDGLAIEGRPGPYPSAAIDSHGDHRIAMAGAVAGLAADGPVRIRDAEAVDVSYPGFLDAIADLGATVEVVPVDRAPPGTG